MYFSRYMHVGEDAEAIEFNNNYSVTPEYATIQPPTDEIWAVSRLSIVLNVFPEPSMSGFGTMSNPLPNGLLIDLADDIGVFDVFESVNTNKNLFRVSTSMSGVIGSGSGSGSGESGFGYDFYFVTSTDESVDVDDYSILFDSSSDAPGGGGGEAWSNILAVIDFMELGEPIILDGGLNQKIRMLLQDDLSSLEKFTIVAHGESGPRNKATMSRFQEKYILPLYQDI